MSQMEIDEYGDKIWRNEEGKLHRLGGPAIETFNGGKYWYRDGLRHRENGAAVEFAGGGREYWYLGKKYFEIKNDAEWKRIIRLMALK